MNYNKIIKNIDLVSGGEEWIPAFIQNKDAKLSSQDNKLIIIQLSGGNDGLNTVVPYQNDLYYNLRPKLGLKQNKLITLDHDLAFNESLVGLSSLYDRGLLSIINAVGYPDPNRSHFRSMDIWQSGSKSRENWNTGWVGRYIDECTSQTGNRHVAIEADDSLSLAMKGENYNGLAVENPAKYFRGSNNRFIKKILRKIERNEHHVHNHGASYLYKTLVETVSSAAYIKEKSKIQASRTTYPRSILGKQLKSIAEFIQSGIQCSIYYATLSGFDTHSAQLKKQKNLLRRYDVAVSAFVKDLESMGHFENTLILTFSEFGRRVAENDSKGTDHGTANNVFLIGKQLKKAGFYNEAVSLTDLDINGDLNYKIDFKRIYATILKKWLNAEDQKILKANYAYLDVI